MHTEQGIKCILSSEVSNCNTFEKITFTGLPHSNYRPDHDRQQLLTHRSVPSSGIYMTPPHVQDDRITMFAIQLKTCDLDDSI